MYGWVQQKHYASWEKKDTQFLDAIDKYILMIEYTINYGQISIYGSQLHDSNGSCCG